MQFIIGTICMVALGAISYGAWLAHPAAGWIVGGFCLYSWAQQVKKLLEGGDEELS